MKIVKTDQEWQALLSPEAYHVARKHGTEAPFSGKYAQSKDKGIYHCVCCKAPLFDSTAKFDSGTGWPSFTHPITPEALEEKRDVTHGMIRIEVLCATCEAHLGHVFPDGPAPSGLRYCMNSICLTLIPPTKES
ncbi:peptide-methionine (R)-S-oxide reductase MsrB [Sulfuricurvum sp.]|uniref:peptide-methionine (R)-S-oxide reductase MsrB n=1 Tax=Sulfuricurvum sp. TaxID=2025608 RepID=UPI003562234F